MLFFELAPLEALPLTGLVDLPADRQGSEHGSTMLTTGFG